MRYLKFKYFIDKILHKLQDVALSAGDILYIWVSDMDHCRGDNAAWRLLNSIFCIEPTKTTSIPYTTTTTVTTTSTTTTTSATITTESATTSTSTTNAATLYKTSLAAILPGRWYLSPALNEFRLPLVKKIRVSLK